MATTLTATAGQKLRAMLFVFVNIRFVVLKNWLRLEVSNLAS